eukprot:scaffold115845_cov58-Phaeocystis_antarctica.AAC.7
MKSRDERRASPPRRRAASSLETRTAADEGELGEQGAADGDDGAAATAAVAAGCLSCRLSGTPSGTPRQSVSAAPSPSPPPSLSLSLSPSPSSSSPSSSVEAAGPDEPKRSNPPPPPFRPAVSSGHGPGSAHAATGGLGAPAARRSRMPEHNAAAAAAVLPGAALPSARCAQAGTASLPCGGAARWPAARGDAVALTGTEAGLEAGLLPPCALPPPAPPPAPPPLTAPSAAPRERGEVSVVDREAEVCRVDEVAVLPLEEGLELRELLPPRLQLRRLPLQLPRRAQVATAQVAAAAAAAIVRREAATAATRRGTVERRAHARCAGPRRAPAS